MPVAALDPLVDEWNLMAFDYQGGGFSNFTGHQSNVFLDTKNPKTTAGWVVEDNSFRPVSTERAINYYKANVASPTKIVLGLPLYGRSFANVVDMSKEKNGLGQHFNGTGEGTWEPGVLDSKDLPQNGSKVYTNDEIIASWSWDPVKKQYVSFDTPQVASWKTEWAMKQGLGGMWFWESSGDRNIKDDKSNIATVCYVLGLIYMWKILMGIIGRQDTRWTAKLPPKPEQPLLPQVQVRQHPCCIKLDCCSPCLGEIPDVVREGIDRSFSYG
jgi:chitinase